MPAPILYSHQILQRMAEELGGNPIIVATGGFAPMIGQGLDRFDRIEPDLTLLGLRLYHDQTVT